MSGLRDAFERWLPIPEYRFVGGPHDGQTLEVRLHETGRGMEAPEMWNLMEPFELPPASWKAPERVAPDAVVRRVSYRFMRANGSINQGYYQFIDAAQP